MLINGKFSTDALGYNKLLGLPFRVSELVEHVEELLK